MEPQRVATKIHNMNYENMATKQVSVKITEELNPIEAKFCRSLCIQISPQTNPVIQHWEIRKEKEEFFIGKRAYSVTHSIFTEPRKAILGRQVRVG